VRYILTLDIYVDGSPTRGIVIVYSKECPRILHFDPVSRVDPFMNELEAIYKALYHAPDNIDIDLYSDNLIIVNQLSLKYKIRSPLVREYFFLIHDLIKKKNVRVNFRYIPREQNIAGYPIEKR